VVEAALASLAHAVPGISASFVTDQHGTSLSTYPPEPAVYGTNFAYRDWFKGLQASGRPFVANAIQTKETSHALAITVTDYIRAPGGHPIGVLGVNYSLESIGEFAAGVGRAQGITLNVTDRTGTSLTAGGQHGLVSLAKDPAVRAALAGRSGLLDYSPLLADGRHGPEVLSAYAPVPRTGWAVMASVNRSAALSGVARLRDAVLALTALLVLSLLATIRIVARSEERLQAERKELQASLKRLAEHDPLTGLWNRRRFEEELHREAARCRRYAECSAVLMIDLDEFKSVNDTHGHQAGDELLELVASRIRAALRQSDSVARIGGDEFAAILPNIAPEDVEHVTDKLRQVILASRITINGTTIGVGASIGSQTLDENVTDPRVVMAKADAAMYQIKATAGR
jgi:diguanylate cyclase (GGDEF)-like protein